METELTKNSIDPAEKTETSKPNLLNSIWHGIKKSIFFILRKIWSAKSYIYFVLLVVFVLIGISELQGFVMKFLWDRKANPKADEQTILDYTQELKKVNEKLVAKYNNLVPKSTYLVINSTENEFFLYKKRELARTGKCSTGSYILLKDGDKKEWIFKTPKGMFSIKGKITNPVWKKPDWAFVEEGLPIPSANHPSRYEYGVLGDYALYLGDGYMLHGTLYKRFIGLPVTHGCVRLGDDDLKEIYNSLSIGSKVIIY